MAAPASLGAAEAGMADYGFDCLDADDRLYRQVGGTIRDVLSVQQQRAQELSYSLWRKNALAKRIIELEKDIICGDGFVVGSPDSDLDRVLQDHWSHYGNEWDKYLPQYVREFAIWGEQIWPAIVNPVSGQVMLGYIDPSNVKAAHKDPLNAKKEGTLILRSKVDEPERKMDIIRYQMDPMHPMYGRLAGEVFFFRANSVIGATRGMPDLYPLVDWLDGYDRMLFDQMERAGLLNSFIWDVELKGFKQADIEEWLKRRRAPRPGSIRAHNENVTWTAVAPDLNSADVTESAKLIKHHVLGGRSLPEHYFAEGGNVNRATAAEMDYPTTKTLESRQAEVVEMVYLAMSFVRDQAIMHNEIRETPETKTITVEPPQVSERDFAPIANSFFSVVQSFAIAREMGWASDDQAIRITSRFSSLLGVDVSPEEVREMMDEVPTADMEPYRRAAERARNKAADADPE